ncbi:TRAP transporter large permease [Clostridiaceae bacterium]|nr:TRAP transporter large permease [Clostridiaceae bacterium]RKI17486.1 TRAP transporter large permease [bacterium 1XD21-70]
MSTDTAAVMILIGVFLVLLFMRVSVAVAMGIAAAVTYMYLGLPLELIVQYTVGGVNNFTFMAVPFFILGGELINQGGIGDRLIRLADEMIGWVHGGAAMVNILASMFFGGISGSAPADIAALGPIEIKLMESQGYTTEYATGLTCATAVQGMLIPPSHNLVIYAVAAGGLSVGSLFLAGLPAGIFMGIVLGIYSFLYAKRKGYASGHKFSLERTGRAFVAALGGLMTIIIIFCGVSFGIMTATESAAVAALWCFISAFFIYRDVPLSRYYKIASSAIKMLSTIMVLLAVANAFGWIIAYLRIPNKIASAILTVTDNKLLILVLINAIVLFLGCVMSISSILLIVTPILVPILTALDYNLVQFGIVMILNLGIGLLTPPVGAALYVGSAVSGLGVGKTAKALMPFYLIMVGTLLALAFVPGLTRILGAW